jgi:hypothetical protein
MLIDIIIQHALLIFLCIAGLFIVTKAILVLFSGIQGGFWLFLGTFAIVDQNDIKNTFDERLKRILQISNKINKVFYIILGANLFIYFFTLLLV